MAKILTDSGYMALPINIKRGNPIPLDTTAVWYNQTELENYAKTGATAYVGQILTLVADSKCEAFMISNEAGTLIKLAQTTASGDLARDVATLQGQVADLISKVGAEAGTDTEATGLYKKIADVLAVANGKVGSVSATDASIVIGGSATAPTVGVQISKAEKNALTLAEDGLKVEISDVKVPEYSIVKKADAGDFSAVYQLTKDSVAVGVDINIPKDLVVKSGEVVEIKAGQIPEDAPEGTTPGTYIRLVLNNSQSVIYINVGSLIEYVTGGSGEDDAIQINVTSDTHKVSASVKNGSLTKAMLASEVQTSLGKADSAIQSVAEGTANGTISVNGEDVNVHGLQDGAYATVASLNQTAQDKANAVKEAVIGGTGDNDGASTIYGAKAYAKALVDSAKADLTNDLKVKIEGLDVTDEAVAKNFVTAVSETDGKIEVSRRALVADDIPTLGISKIDGLQTALNGKQDSLVFNTAYDSSTNKVATMTDVKNAKDALVGTEKDTKASDTIKGAKLYADSKDNAIAEAKQVADSAKSAVDNLVNGTTELSYVKKSGDTMTGNLTLGSNSLIFNDQNRIELWPDGTWIHFTGGAGFDGSVSVSGDLFGTGEVFGKSGSFTDEVKVGNINISESGGGIYLTGGSPNPIVIQNVGDGSDIFDAVNKGQLDEVSTIANDAKTAVEELSKKDFATKTEAQGYANEVQKSVTALSEKVGTLPEGATATTVVGYVDEKIGKIPAQTDYSVTVTPSEVVGVAKRYTIAQASTGLNVNIDIPKDMVVSAGSVETNPAGQPAGTYLVLTLANATNDKVYIDVGSLIEYVTSGSGTTDMVKIAISADHKVTASITDGSITKAKLTTAVQGSLDKADSAIQQAGLTTALEPYAKTADVAKGYVAKETGKRLMTDAEGTKLGGIETGAQVNKIESIKVGGTALEITEKAVNISQISTDLLINGTKTLILNCGNANT